MADILAPVSAGDLVDRLSILRLKSERFEDPTKRANVLTERQALEAVAAHALPASDDLAALSAQLHGINATLWTIEDDIRACEARGDFGPDFIRLARAVYQTNDRRSAVKREINRLLGSEIIEEKSYGGRNGGDAGKG
ncbi:MAG: DUF6165 family protein [Pseudomonadota bacterium]|nr:DUF6165 family protein [Pseudomonadota bacterium]